MTPSTSSHEVPSAPEPVTVPELLDIAAGTLGPCQVVADRSWPHGEARVLDVVDDRHRR